MCVRAATPALTASGQEALRAAQVVTALRGDRLRVSPHLYSSPEDVDRLVAALLARG
jgi:selenocysteine lyase/cysteine desulfurase